MKFPLVVATALLAAGCSGAPPLRSSENLTVVDRGSLPTPTTADFSDLTRDYVLGPFDKVAVDVFGLPEFSRTLQIDASGRISLPLTGALQASGLSAAELERQVASALRAGHVRDPKVSINVVDLVSQVVTVDGEVQNPGTIQAAGKLTLMRAIARAGGATEFARLDYVAVIRTVGGKRMAALYDVRAVRQGLYDDPDVFPNDIVLVGTSKARRIFRDIIQSAPLLSAPLIAILN